MTRVSHLCLRPQYYTSDFLVRDSSRGLPSRGEQPRTLTTCRMNPEFARKVAQVVMKRCKLVPHGEPLPIDRRSQFRDRSNGSSLHRPLGADRRHDK